MSSVRDDILRDLIEHLENCREGQGARIGFDAVFDHLDGMPKQKTWAHVDEDEEEVVEEAYPTVHRRLPVEVFAQSRVTDNHGQMKRWLLADIQDAVMKDPQRGGNAVSTDEVANAAESNGDTIVAWCRFEILYQTNRQDPSSKVN